MTTPRRVNGADISHWQSRVDLAKAKASGLQFIYLKATEDEAYKDPTFSSRLAEARRIGLKVGAYHFARPEAGDARVEARRFISVAQPKPGDCLPMLDLETMGELRSLTELRNWARDFIDEVKKLIGVKPTVYGSYDLGDATKGCVIWRPRYNNSNTPPKLAWDVWQFSNGVYGVPNSFPGLGNVDLNTFRAGFTLNDLLIPKKEAPKPAPAPKPLNPSVPEDSDLVQIMFVPGQFSDSDAEHTADAKKIFARAKNRNREIVMGTEGGAGSGNWIPALQDAAKAQGFRFFTHSSTDTWIAVRKDFVTGNWEEVVGPIVVPGKAFDHTAKRIIAVGFDTKNLGRIYATGMHYLTKGRPGDPNPEWRQHVEENKALAKAIGEFTTKYGAGTNLVFYAGDQNIIDKQYDTFFGRPLTSAWDELKKWEDTGHGNIDVIASYNYDNRVKAISVDAKRDAEFRLNTDHFLLEASYAVRRLA